VFTLFATMVVIATAAHAQQNTRNFYNSHGAFAGTARTHGNVWYLRIARRLNAP
jgi:hypothetical protein